MSLILNRWSDMAPWGVWWLILLASRTNQSLYTILFLLLIFPLYKTKKNQLYYRFFYTANSFISSRQKWFEDWGAISTLDRALRITADTAKMKDLDKFLGFFPQVCKHSWFELLSEKWSLWWWCVYFIVLWEVHSCTLRYKNNVHRHSHHNISCYHDIRLSVFWKLRCVHCGDPVFWTWEKYVMKKRSDVFVQKV